MAPHPYFSHAAIGLSLIPGFIGLSTVINPLAALRSADFPLPSDAQGQRSVAAIARIYGSRNVAITYLLFLAWRAGNPRHLGLGLLAAVWMTGIDGFIFRDLTGGGEWNHWIVVPIATGISAGLLGWIG